MLDPYYLDRVRLPGQYLGREVNSVKKDWEKVSLRIALGFPDAFEVGMCHLGLAILYGVLNRRGDILAERVFAPGVDLENMLRDRREPLTSLESNEPVSRFDIVGFSLQTELGYTNVLNMLELGGIPLKASERDETHPLILGGGPCAANPEPMAAFFDAILVGDGEEAVLRIADQVIQWKEARGGREDLLKRLAAIRGVYVPRFFEPDYDESGEFLGVRPLLAGYASVEKSLIEDLETVAYPGTPILPSVKVVHDRLTVEIARGCGRGCRFCQAGMLYRPIRERSPERVMELVENGLAATGYEDVSLLSLSTGDYSCLDGLLTGLMDRLHPRRVSLSLPSLRVGSISGKLMEQIRRVRKTGFTFAPEAATQRLRDVINKNIREEDLVQAASQAFSLGWKVIKLYFMIGLPTETWDDVKEIPELARRILRSGGKKGGRTVNVGYGLFVPKPQTPFQWCAQEDLEGALEKMDFLRRTLSRAGLQPKWNSARMALVEGCLARGGREAAEWVLRAYRLGCRFDGWTEQFRFELWERALEDSGVPGWEVIQRARDPEKPLPWDHIHLGVDRTFFESEYRKAVSCLTTQDCRVQCGRCGVCDHKQVGHRLAECAATAETVPTESAPAGEPVRYRFTFEKRGSARYLGHLDTAAAFKRAARRAGLPLKYSEGFHPQPGLSFQDALPLGMESLEESGELALTRAVAPDLILEGINLRLPEGFRLLEVTERSKKPSPPKGVELSVSGPSGWFDPGKVRDFPFRRGVSHHD